jgi:hypothetical protein
MRTAILFAVLLLVLPGCGKSQKKDKAGTDTSTSQRVDASPTANTIELPQHGDYSSLFIREENDCTIITAEGVAEALQIAPSKSAKEEQAGGICRFTAELVSGTKVMVSVQYFKIPNDHVKSEIKKAKDNHDFHRVKISDTGDTYLVTRGQGGQVQIYNTHYAGAAEIRAIERVETGLPKHTEESRKQRYEEVIKIANYIVTNHKN